MIGTEVVYNSLRGKTKVKLSTQINAITKNVLFSLTSGVGKPLNIQILQKPTRRFINYSNSTKNYPSVSDQVHSCPTFTGFNNGEGCPNIVLQVHWVNVQWI